MFKVKDILTANGGGSSKTALYIYKRKKKRAFLYFRMLHDIKDLLNIDSEIERVENERSQLGKQLQLAQQRILSDSEKANFYDKIVTDIESTVHSVADVNRLRTKYGDLKILTDIENNFHEHTQRDTQFGDLENARNELETICAIAPEELSYYEIAIIHEKLQSVVTNSTLLDKGILEDIQNRFDLGVLRPYAEYVSKNYESMLLDSKWGTEGFLLSDSEALMKLKKPSSELFKLSKLYFMQKNVVLWNFQCLAYPFKVRFTYHFHDNSTTFEMYFKFLSDYLRGNLYKCINLFSDESIGLTKEVVHEQFICHILKCIRERISITLAQNDTKTLVALISQIISTDQKLINLFHYRGEGLASLISESAWERWLDYEIAVVNRQFQAITNDLKDFYVSGANFCRLFKRMYEYLEPFYVLDYPSLLQFKLKTCSKIFLQLSSDYLDFVLTVDTLDEQRTKEEELNQTMLKLQNLSVVYDKLYEMSGYYIFIRLTDLVNSLDKKRYFSIFSDLMGDYWSNMEIDLKNSIISRIQNFVKSSLGNYFKINSWLLNAPPSELEVLPTSEVVDSVSLLKRLISKLDVLSVPPSIILGVKNELLNRVVNYLTESILKLNKFNEHGLNQLEVDYRALKEALNIPGDVPNSEDLKFLEIFKLLRLRYANEDIRENYINSGYIKDGEFTHLRKHLDLQFLNDSEIQDCLYRILYGNIV